MMKTATTTPNGLVLMVMMLAALSIQSTPPAQAADSHVKGTMVFTPIEELGVPMGELAVMASGAAASEQIARESKAR